MRMFRRLCCSQRRSWRNARTFRGWKKFWNIRHRCAVRGPAVPRCAPTACPVRLCSRVREKTVSAPAYGLLVTQNRIVLTDDSASLPPLLHRIAQEKRWTKGTVGQTLYDFFEQLIARDLHRLEELEEQAEALEDQVLADGVDSLSAAMNALRKETMALFRYYSQLDDVACELCENENGFFSETETERFHLFEGRVARLRENAQLLCEYCRQIQSAFQAQIDIRQNRVMQILTIVTTIFLPLTLLTGWYGMNFVNMPELSWKYGYLMVGVISAAVLVLGLWICKKKKFW